MITAITTTGDRPEAFDLCRRWMNSQTVKPDQWIVIDDGWTPIREELRGEFEYHRREPSEGEGHTLLLNLKESFAHIKGDKILIIEDDDWYGPNYVKVMSDYLNKFDLVGEGHARYYMLPIMKYRRIGNYRHVSFCQTGFRDSILKNLKTCLLGDPYIDSRLWAQPIPKKHIFFDDTDKLCLHCSIKGLKGRRGIGTGHNPDSSYYRVDNKLTKLRKWVGEENARLYMNEVGQSYRSAILLEDNRKVSKRITVMNEVSQGSDITVITCTGDRPESFERLKYWMWRQTLKPQQWIVVDDGELPIRDSVEFEYLRREPQITDYEHTLSLNLLAALQNVRHNKIIFMEDDDWYHPTYLDYMSKLLDRADLVGFGNAVFYHVPSAKYMLKGSPKQPTLAQTAMKKDLIPVLQGICENADKEFNICGKGLVDKALWAHSLDFIQDKKAVKLMVSLKMSTGRVLSPGHVFFPPVPDSIIRRAERRKGAEYLDIQTSFKGTKLVVQTAEYISVGMKGLPGRMGLTSHHQETKAKYQSDPNYRMLKSILKEDITKYI